MLSLLDSTGLPYPYLLLLLPGVVVGTRRLITEPGPWNALPVLATLALMALGLVWSDQTELGRGALLVAGYSSSLPIAALIRGRADWVVAVKAFLGGSIVSYFYLLLVYLTDPRSSRLGTLYDDTNKRQMDPNDFAIQMGFAMILAITLVGSTTLYRTSQLRFLIPLTALISGIAIILSGSRGASLATIVALGTVLLLRKWPKGTGFRLFWIAYSSVLAVSLILVVPNPIRARLTTESVETAGSRTPIWEAGVAAILSSVKSLTIGAGTGSSDKTLAIEVLKNPTITNVSQDAQGIWRSNAHSTYVDWLISYGFIGIFVGGSLIIYLIMRSRSQDIQAQSPIGIGLLFFFLAASVTMMATRLEALSIIGFSLLLGYLGLQDLNIRRSGQAARNGEGAADRSASLPTDLKPLGRSVH